MFMVLQTTPSFIQKLYQSNFFSLLPSSLSFFTLLLADFSDRVSLEAERLSVDHVASGVTARLTRSNFGRVAMGRISSLSKLVASLIATCPDP